MKVILIDDEPLARMIVKEYLQSYYDLEVIEECSNGFEGLKAIQQHNPDLIFLDIQMPKITGFEMLELLEQPPSVIFTTAFDEYAIKAFDTHAVDYLLKPFSKERFDKAIQKWRDQNYSGNKKVNQEELLQMAAQSPVQCQRIVVKMGPKIRIIPVKDIIFLEAADDYVKIHTTEGVFLKNNTMNHFEGILDAQQFVRCHRSYMINVQDVVRIEPHERDSHLALLADGHSAPVSRNGYSKLKMVLGI